jgi:hypothetical protein
VRGTSTALEKSYFRLNAAPRPDQVRPPPVIASALARLVGIIAQRGRPGVSAHYKFYYCDQFKAQRQDLVVQGVKDAVTVQVREGGWGGEGGGQGVGRLCEGGVGGWLESG